VEPAAKSFGDIPGHRNDRLRLPENIDKDRVVFGPTHPTDLLVVDDDIANIKSSWHAYPISGEWVDRLSGWWSNQIWMLSDYLHPLLSCETRRLRLDHNLTNQIHGSFLAG
jgi:hypothetical protein